MVFFNMNQECSEYKRKGTYPYFVTRYSHIDQKHDPFDLIMDCLRIEVTKNCYKRAWDRLKDHFKKMSCRGKVINLNRTSETYNNGLISFLLSEEMEALERSVAEGRWEYRGEGNANLVIALLEERIILRFYKWEYKDHLMEVVVKQGEEKVKRNVKFCHLIMEYFLGRAYVQPPLFTRIPDEVVAQIDTKILLQRPAPRRHKGIRFGCVTVSPDYAFLPPILNVKKNLCIVKNNLKNRINSSTFCVEIKPKQGWIYPRDRLYPKCTFCINQYLKVEKKSVSKLSKYCPLDLFSGNKIRMKRAIKNLLETPQNNLKIFQDGYLKYSDDCGSYLEVLGKWLEPGNSHEECHQKVIDKWCSLIQESLLKELTEEVLPTEFLEDHIETDVIIENACCSPLENVCIPCDWTSDSLPRNSILNRILGLQKLHQSSFSTVYERYILLKKEEEEDYDYLKNLSTKKSLNTMERYLLSATANDCSILISFQQTDKNLYEIDPVHYIKDANGMPYMMNIGVSDLDPKPLSCVAKHYKRDKDMVGAWFNNIATTTNSWKDFNIS